MPGHVLLLLFLYVPFAHALPTPERSPQTTLSPGSIAAICCIAIILILILILLFITRRVFLIHRQLNISRSVIENDTLNPSQFSNKNGILVGLLGSPVWESQVSSTLGRLSTENPAQYNSQRSSSRGHPSRSLHGSQSSRASTSQCCQYHRMSSESERRSSVTRPKRAHTPPSSHSSRRSRHSRRSSSLKRTPSQPKQSVSFDDSALRLISFSLEDMQQHPLPNSPEQFTLPMLQASSPLSPLNVYEGVFRHSALQKQQDFPQTSTPYPVGKPPKSSGTQSSQSCTESMKENLNKPTAPFSCGLSGGESDSYTTDTTFSPPLTSTPKSPPPVFPKQQLKSKSLGNRRASLRQPSPLRNTFVPEELGNAPAIDTGYPELIHDSATMRSGDVLDIIKELVNETSAWHDDLFINDEFKTMVGRELKDNVVESSPSPPPASYPTMELYVGSTWFDLPEIDESPEYEEQEDEPPSSRQSRYSPSLNDGQSAVGVAR